MNLPCIIINNLHGFVCFQAAAGRHHDNAVHNGPAVDADRAALASDQFTALVELERSLETEHELSHHLHDYVRKEEERLGKLREPDSMAEHSEKVLKDPVKYLGNPVNAFQLVKRFTVDWDNAEHIGE